MSIITSTSISPYIIISTLLIFTYFVSEINGHNEGSIYAAEINNLSSSRKLDESSDPSIKCGGCSPCGHPSCYQSPPPPPPPSPPPPPPTPKKPPSGTTYCPPPPPSSWIYVPAPPGGLYPVDPNYSYFSGGVNFAANLKIIVGYGLLQLIILWI